MPALSEARFGFRFTALGHGDLRRLRALMPRVGIASRRHGDRVVASFHLSEEFDLEALRTFLREVQPNPATYSVWVSLTTASDLGGIAVPDPVLALIRETSGGVDFSFVSCLGDGRQ